MTLVADLADIPQYIWQKFPPEAPDSSLAGTFGTAPLMETYTCLVAIQFAFRKCQFLNCSVESIGRHAHSLGMDETTNSLYGALLVQLNLCVTEAETIADRLVKAYDTIVPTILRLKVVKRVDSSLEGVHAREYTISRLRKSLHFANVPFSSSAHQQLGRLQEIPA